jgi:hypothetical protein
MKRWMLQREVKILTEAGGWRGEELIEIVVV